MICFVTIIGDTQANPFSCNFKGQRYIDVKTKIFRFTIQLSVIMDKCKLKEKMAIRILNKIMQGISCFFFLLSSDIQRLTKAAKYTEVEFKKRLIYLPVPKFQILHHSV